MPFLLILPKVAKAGRGGIVGWKWNPCLGDGWWAGPTNPLITPNTQQSMRQPLKKKLCMVTLSLTQEWPWMETPQSSRFFSPGAHCGPNHGTHECHHHHHIVVTP